MVNPMKILYRIFDYWLFITLLPILVVLSLMKRKNHVKEYWQKFMQCN